MRNAILPGDAKDALETPDGQCSQVAISKTRRSAADQSRKMRRRIIVSGSEVSAPEPLRFVSLP